MTERAKALEILRRARDLLADRLTERILESEEELLDDARGDSYLSDIESLFDAFGSKITHLNQLINNLPAEVEAPASSTSYQAAPDYSATGFADAAAVDELVTSHPAAITGPLIIAPPALPAPRLEETDVSLPTFALFVNQVRAEELLAAGRTLAILLDLSETRGFQCARVFDRRWEEDDSFALKAMQLRGEVINSSYNAALILLAECFGLVGIEAINVLQTLRSRFA